MSFDPNNLSYYMYQQYLQHQHLQQHAPLLFKREPDEQQEQRASLKRPRTDDNVGSPASQLNVKSATWVCSECKKLFTSKSNLKVHIRVHTRVKPYHCKLCAYSCMHHSSIRDHLLKLHPGAQHSSAKPCYAFNAVAVPDPEQFNSSNFDRNAFIAEAKVHNEKIAADISFSLTQDTPDYNSNSNKRKRSISSNSSHSSTSSPFVSPTDSNQRLKFSIDSIMSSTQAPVTDNAMQLQQQQQFALFYNYFAQKAAQPQQLMAAYVHLYKQYAQQNQQGH